MDAFLLQPGLSRIDVLVNPRSAAAVTISLWESEEAMKATDDDAEHLRSHIVLEVLGWIDRVSEYELMRTEQVQRGLVKLAHPVHVSFGHSRARSQATRSRLPPREGGRTPVNLPAKLDH
ncbi:MAG: hypothetical protein ACR2M2_02000 [Gaiellaceae bacterium]